MKKMMKFIPLVVLSLVGFFALGTNRGSVKSANAASESFKIGICQLVSHEALDAATKGFMDKVKEELGDAVTFDLQNAAGDSGTCATITNSFVSQKVDLIMANATPALQAAANSTTSIPILGTSITEYGVALGIPNFTGVTGMNVSGTSDLAPLTEQGQMLIDVFPEAKKVGLLYCSAEANSLYQVNVVKAFLEGKGLTTKTLSFADSNDIASVLNGSINDIDALYIPTDNTCASSAGIIDSICAKKNLPVVAGEENLCRECGAITLSISYYNIGVKTGEMAVSILKDKADIRTMPIAYDEHPVKKYNPDIMKRLGLEAPNGYVAIEMPEPVKKGCGGSIIASSVIISMTALLGTVLLVSRRRKEEN